MRRAVRTLKEKNVESLAILFVHAYANAAHEALRARYARGNEQERELAGWMHRLGMEVK